MIRILTICALPFAVAGCVTPGQAPDSAASAETIEYSLTPCFGFCPSFRLSVARNGAGTYHGERFVQQKGTAAFTASQREFEAFAERLAPFRPESSVAYGYENCDGPVATDSPSVKITWHEAGREPVTLDWYLGCRQPGLVENRDALYQAWQELPVDDLVGTAENRQIYDRLK
ncbi:DUF6438 domain-containing protein [Citromicrobium bathyomarinum]|jgi:hypothetical protein|uniref:DUF6438 domain-containing protein n=1 Tax=Citromicrobium bathyomarinum TaxID=72174 RepID=UPI00315A3D3B